MVYHTKRMVVVITVLILLAAFFSGCFNDGTASIFQSDLSAVASETYGSLIIVPVHREYGVGGVFNKETDFTPLVVHSGGDVETLNAADVSVSIKEDPTGDHPPTPLLDERTYKFEKSGEKLIFVSYKEKKARYGIWVVPDIVVSPPDTNDNTSIIITVKD